MSENNIITAIDIGTSKIVTLIGIKSSKGIIKVIGTGISDCDGLIKGFVENISKTRIAIINSLAEAEAQANVKVSSAFIGITGTHLEFLSRVDYFSSIGSNGVITSNEINEIPILVTNMFDENNREIIHVFSGGYRIDGHDVINDPVGMHAKGIDATSHLVTANSEALMKIRECFSETGISLDSCVFQPFVNGQVFLNTEEKFKGSAVIDIGKGTTDIAVFKNGTMVYTSVIPVGGFQFTNDICLTYQISYKDAEEIKLRYAHTIPSGIDMKEEIRTVVAESNTEIKISRRELAQLMRERALELIRLIDLKLQQSGLTQDPNSRIVISGGGSHMDGLYDMAKQFLQCNHVNKAMVEKYHEYGIAAKNDIVAYSALGILLYAFSQHRNTYSNKTKNDKYTSIIFKKIKSAINLKRD
jgi:cell division protein FtsA